MKKLLLLVMAVVLCLSLVACGEKKEEPTVDNVNQPTVDTNEYVDEPVIDLEPEIIEVTSGDHTEEVSGDVAPIIEVSGEVTE